MGRKQLITLFIINLVPFFVCQAMLPLLPVYALTIEANQGMAGLYLACLFASLAAGTLAGGWLSDRFQQRKRILIVSGFFSTVTTPLIGLAEDMVFLIVVNMLAWLFAGITMSIVGILAGIYAPSDRRGQVFGLLGVGVALGRALGGLVSGPIVDQWGFRTMFFLFALPCVIQIIAGLFVEDKLIERTTKEKSFGRIFDFNYAFGLLLLATFLGNISSFSANLGRPLMMNAQGYDATAISSISVVGGAATLPLPFIVGWLSDRLGRKQLLVFSYIAASLSALILLSSNNIWHFWLGSILFSIQGAAGPVASALVTDLVKPDKLSLALSWYSTIPWVGGILGFGATGYIIQSIGLETTFLISAALPILSILLILMIHGERREVPA